MIGDIGFVDRRTVNTWYARIQISWVERLKKEDTELLINLKMALFSRSLLAVESNVWHEEV